MAIKHETENSIQASSGIFKVFISLTFVLLLHSSLFIDLGNPKKINVIKKGLIKLELIGLNSDSKNLSKLGKHKSNFKNSKTKTHSSKVKDATIISSATPQYPYEARLLNQMGNVKLKIQLNENGKVVHADIINSSGYKLLDNSALKASYNTHFNKSKRSSRTTTLNFNFSLVDKEQ